MKVIFSDSFLEDSSRKDVILRMTNYSSVWVQTGNISDFSVLVEDDIKNLSSKFPSGTRISSPTNIDGIWELESEILKLVIEIPSGFGRQEVPHNLVYFYYKNIYDEEKLAFILVPDGITDKNNLRSIVNLKLGLCSGRNLINIPFIPGRQCGFDFPGRDTDITFLERVNKADGINVFANIDSTSLVFKKSYQKYMVWGDRESYPNVDFYFNTYGELLTNKYTVQRIVDVYLDSPQSFSESGTRKVVYVGGDEETINLSGYFKWEEYEIIGDDRTLINSGTSDLSLLTSGSINISKVEKKENDLDIKYSSDFKDKTITISETKEKGKGEIEVKISVTNYVEEVEIILSNSLYIVQEYNDWAWDIDYSGVGEQYKEDNLPLLVIGPNAGNIVEIKLTTNSDSFDFEVLDQVLDEGITTFDGGPKNSLKVLCDLEGWDNYFFVHQPDKSGMNWYLTIRATKTNNTNSWYGLDPKGNPAIAKFTLILGGNRSESFYVVQKPIESYNISVLKRGNITGQFELVDKVVLYNDPNYITEKDNQIVLFPAILDPSSSLGDLNIGWSLVSGGCSLRTFTNSEGKEQFSVRQQPHQGDLAVCRKIDNHYVLDKENGFTLWVDEVNPEHKEIFLGNLILTKGTNETVTENDWRILICNATASIPVYLGESKSFLKISPDSGNFNIDNIFLDSKLQSFNYYIKSNCPFVVHYIDPKSLSKENLPELTGIEIGAASVGIYRYDFPINSNASMDNIALITDYDYKEGSEFGGILHYLGYLPYDPESKDPAKRSPIAYLGRIVVTSEDGLCTDTLDLLVNKSSNDSLGDPTYWNISESLKEGFIYGIWGDKQEDKLVNIVKNITCKYPLKSLSGYYDQSRIYPGEKLFRFSEDPNHPGNLIKSQNVVYNELTKEYDYSTLGLSYSVNSNTSVSRYPVLPVGDYVVQTANKDDQSEITEPNVRIPVLIKGEPGKVSLETEDKGKYTQQTTLEVPYVSYPEEEGDIDFNKTVTGLKTFFKDVELFVDDLTNRSGCIVLGNNCTLDLAGHSLLPKVHIEEPGKTYPDYLIIISGSKVTIKNGSIRDLNSNSQISSVFLLEDSSSLTLENVYIESNKTIFTLAQYSNLTINSGIYKCHEDYSVLSLIGKFSKANINGGSFYSRKRILEIPEMIIYPTSTPTDYVEISGGKYYNFDPNRDFSLDEEWGDTNWLKEGYEEIDLGDGYTRIKKIDEVYDESKDTVTFEIPGYYKFYIKSTYKFVEKDIWSNITFLNATKIANGRYKSAYTIPGLNWFTIERTDRDPFQVNKDWMYEFKIYINGYYPSNRGYTSTLCYMFVTYRMDLNSLVSPGTVPWINNKDPEAIIKNSYIDEICPPYTATFGIIWKKEYSESNTLYTDDQFILSSTVSVCQITGGKFDGSIWYQGRTTSDGKYIEPPMDIYDWRVVYTSNCTVTRENDASDNFTITIPDYLSKYKNTLISINPSEGFDSRASTWRELGYDRSVEFSIEWFVRPGKESEVRNPNQTFMRTCYITQRRLPYVSFIQYQGKLDALVGIPSIPGGTSYLEYFEEGVKFYAAFFSLESIVNYLDGKTSTITGKWPTQRSNFDTSGESRLTSIHSYSNPIYYKNTSLWAQQGYEFLQVPANKSANRKSWGCTVGYHDASSNLDFNISLTATQNPNPDGDLFTPGFENGCTLFFSAGGSCLSGYKYFNSSTAVIPEFETTRNLADLQFKAEYTNLANGNRFTELSDLGFNLPLGYLSRGAGSGNRRRYTLLTQLPENNTGKIVGLGSRDDSDVYGYLKLVHKTTQEVIWQAKIVQGTVTLRPHNQQTNSLTVRDISTKYGGTRNLDSINYDDTESDLILGPIQLSSYSSNTSSPNSSRITFAKLLTGGSDIVYKEVDINSITSGKDNYSIIDYSSTINRSTDIVQYVWNTFNSSGTIPDFLRGIEDLSYYSQELITSDIQNRMYVPYLQFTYTTSMGGTVRKSNIYTKIGFKIKYKEAWRSNYATESSWMYFGVHYVKPSVTVIPVVQQ